MADLPILLEIYRPNKKWLGFFPRGAFLNFIAACNIRVLRDGTGEINGFITFRETNEAIPLVHVCVRSQCRKSGLASHMLSIFLKSFEDDRPFRAWCRKDYGLQEFWKGLGFSYTSEKPGRSAEGSTLQLWECPGSLRQAPNLYESAARDLQDDRLVAAIDANAFYGIHDEDRPDCLPLSTNPWLEDALCLAVTSEIFNEFERDEDKERSSRHQALAATYAVLKAGHRDLEEARQKVRRGLQLQTRVQGRSDERHLMQAVADGATFFVTLDTRLLNASDSILAATGVSVLRPLALVAHFQQLLDEEKYSPRNLDGQSTAVRRYTAHDTDQIWSSFGSTTELKKSAYRERIDRLHTCGEDAAVLAIESNGSQIGKRSRVPPGMTAPGRLQRWREHGRSTG